MSLGAQFSELEPRDPKTNVPGTAFVTLPANATPLNNGTIFQFTSLNRFRLGQQMFIWLGVSSSVFNNGNSWISKLRLKPWWLRPNLEYRAPGDPEYTGLDRETFGGTTIDNNRYVWMPSPKRLDITEFCTSPPSLPPPNESDSLMLDDLWTFGLQDASDPNYQNLFAPDQELSRWDVFLYPAMGYAIGFTWEAEIGGEETEEAVQPRISFTWKTGTIRSTFQEDVG